jgi:hypothetical protein
MDFSLTDEQQAIRDLAEKILSEQVRHERLLELERSGEWFDLAVWRELSALPEACGGSGLSVLELCLVLERVGRHVAPVPLFASSVLGAAPIAEFGTAAQQARLLRPLVERGAVLSAALTEPGSSDPARPAATARCDGCDWRLDGAKTCVPAGLLAEHMLVPARTPEGVGVFALDAGATGVARERQVATSGEPQALVSLDGARVAGDDLIGDPAGGAAIVDWLLLRASVALAAIQVGVCEGALHDTARYVAQRKQFGRPIATFQAVALRAADAYIDTCCLRAVVEQAAWRISAGRPADAEVAAAKWWAATAGMRVVHSAQHLHGGIGSDIEYPVHRYFLWAKQSELLFGGARQQLARLGDRLVQGGAHVERE